MGEIPKIPSSSARSLQDRFSVIRPAYFQDERSIEMQIVEMVQAARPS
jgi:hypothetical protein